MNRFIRCAGGTVLLVACGASTPTQQLSDSQAAIRAAQEVGANSNPDASLHLELANEQLNKAQEEIDDGDEEEARQLLERAEADANLAIALANLAETRQSASQTQERIQELRERNL